MPALNRRSFTWIVAAIFSLLHGGALAQPCLEWANTENAPPVREQGAIAYDSARDVVVLFGGLREYHDAADSSTRRNYLNDTWEWNGSTWQLLEPSSRPSPSFGHQMTYDSARDVTVLVGGYTQAGDWLKQTWEWDGVNWSQRTSHGGLGDLGSLVFDPIRNASLYVRRDEVLAWDGVSWTPLPAANEGPNSGEFWWIYSQAAAFDSNRDAIVVVNCALDGQQELFETWERSGDLWTQLQPPVHPSPRRNFNLYYDAARSRTLLVGGYRQSQYFDDIWEWDGANWALLAQHGGLGRLRTALAYDENHGVVLLYGGASHFPGYPNSNPTNSLTQLMNNDLWSYDGAWSILYEFPPPRHGHKMVFDSLRGKVTMFGGYENIGWGARHLDDTWEWDGGTWTRKAEVVSPSARLWHAMAYDSGRGRAVLFGGLESGLAPARALGDTWEWDGDQWQLVATSGPARRYGHVMAYDPQRGVTVLYGGTPWTGGGANDTWEWDGQDWELKNNHSLSFARTQASMAYDASIGRVVLYGGGVLTDPKVCYEESWEWNGTDWVRRGMDGPAAGVESTMVYNHSTASLLLFGGRDACNGDQLSGTTWKRIAGQWVETDSGSNPSPRHGHAMTYDSVRHEVVLFGGTNGSPVGTWGANHSGSAMAAEVALLQPDFPLSAPTYEVSSGCSAGSYIKKNRYLSFLPPSPADPAILVALRVTLSEMPGATNCNRVPDFSAAEGAEMWIGAETAAGSGVYRLQATPFFRDWAAIEGGIVHVADCNIVPCATYIIEAITEPDYPGGLYSSPLALSTSPVWGDIVGTSANEPDGIVDFTDISVCLDSFRNAPSAPSRSRCDLASLNPFQGARLPIDFSDISAVVDAFKGANYPFPAPTAPAACP